MTSVASCCALKSHHTPHFHFVHPPFGSTYPLFFTTPPHPSVQTILPTPTPPTKPSNTLTPPPNTSPNTFFPLTYLRFLFLFFVSSPLSFHIPQFHPNPHQQFPHTPFPIFSTFHVPTVDRRLPLSLLFFPISPTFPFLSPLFFAPSSFFFSLFNPRLFSLSCTRATDVPPPIPPQQYFPHPQHTHRLLPQLEPTFCDSHHHPHSMVLPTSIRNNTTITHKHQLYRTLGSSEGRARGMQL